RHTRFSRDWSSDVCSSDLTSTIGLPLERPRPIRVELREIAAAGPIPVRRAGGAALPTVFNAWGQKPGVDLEMATFPVEGAGQVQIGRASCRERAQKSSDAG